MGKIGATSKVTEKMDTKKSRLSKSQKNLAVLIKNVLLEYFLSFNGLACFE
jgi:hypothetical protein